MSALHLQAKLYVYPYDTTLYVGAQHLLWGTDQTRIMKYVAPLRYTVLTALT